jgi:hypothetical protein
MTTNVPAPFASWRTVVCDEDLEELRDDKPIWLQFNIEYVLHVKFLEWCTKNKVKTPKLIVNWVTEADATFSVIELAFPNAEDAIVFKLLWEGDATLSNG